MMKRKILVLTDHMPWGHRSIARAIFGYLKDKEKENSWEIKYTEVKMPYDTFNDLYTFVYRYIPATNRLTKQIMDNQKMRELFSEMSSFSFPEMKKQITRFKPDLVISAYFAYSHTLERMRQKEGYEFKLWTIVADPWSINPISYVPGADKHLVYDETGINEGIKYGIDRDKLIKTGWWVRKEMYQLTDREKIRKKLGLTDNRPVVFVGGGSLGTSSISRLLPVLMLVKKPVAVIFNTGTDKLVFNLVEEYIRIFKRLRQNDLVIIKNMGWIENMAEILSVCDIVFGKAGPNFIFDVVAVGKPIVAITHIGGQEDGNIDLIRKKHLGWIKEKGSEMAEMFLDFLDNPKLALKFDDYVQKEKSKNKMTMSLIQREVK